MKFLPFRLALQGLNNRKSFALTMVFNIALGITGFLVVIGFSESFTAKIASRTQSMASGDLVASARLKPSEDHIEKLRSLLPKGSVESADFSTLTMVRSKASSRLVDARFVDRTFPLYGQFQLQKKGLQKPEVGHMLFGKPVVWIYPDLKTQLGIEIGDELEIGSAKFIVDDVIDEDPAGSGSGFSLAPRIYLSMDAVGTTGLITEGSRVYWAWRYKIPDPSISESLEKTLGREFKDGEIKIRSHKNAAQELTRIQQYLNDYLGVVALAALFLSSVGSAFLMRGHLLESREFC